MSTKLADGGWVDDDDGTTLIHPTISSKVEVNKFFKALQREIDGHSNRINAPILFKGNNMTTLAGKRLFTQAMKSYLGENCPLFQKIKLTPLPNGHRPWAYGIASLTDICNHN